jgi:catechol 2,3-dioxygenase-like lactoylglutathione lyase family enzyme
MDQSPSRVAIDRIDHVNLVVNDMATMVEFYRDVLGLRLTKQAVITGEWIDTVTGLSHVEAEVAFLEPAAGPAIELLRYRTPAGTRPDGLGVPNAQGFRHMAFRVRDIDRLAASLAAAGVEFISPLQRVPAVQVDYADVRKSLLYFRDPEGNLLELCAFE